MKGVRLWLYHLWSSQFCRDGRFVCRTFLFDGADPGSLSQELHFSWALATFAADLQGLRHKCDDILFQTPVSEFLPLNH
jgi:hypothetical protein